MPPTTTTGLLYQKLGNVLLEAHEEYKDVEVDYGFSQLPGGIENGIAQLAEMRFQLVKEGGKNAGAPMFYASGIVKLPLEHEGIPTQGQRTQIMKMIVDNPNSQGELKTRKQVMGWVYNELKKFDLIVSDLDLQNDPDALERAVATLAAQRPHFRFRTFKPDKQVIEQAADGFWYIYDQDKYGNLKASRNNKGKWPTREDAQQANPYAGREPNVIHLWGGWVDFKEQSDPAAGVNDDSPQAPPPSAAARGLAGNGVTRTAPARTPARQAPAAATAAPTAAAPATARATQAPATAAPAAPVKTATAAPVKATAPATRTTTKKAASAKVAEPAPVPVEPEPVQEYRDDMDLSALVQRAMVKDKEAQGVLRQHCFALGYTEEQVDNTQTWQEVADMILAGAPAAATEAIEPPVTTETAAGGAEEVPFVPGLEDVYGYRPIDRKTKEPQEKQMRCEVVEVDADSGTCTLLWLGDKKTMYRNVSFDDLETWGS